MHVGLGAVVGAVSRNLHEIQDRQGSYLPIHDPPVFPLQDPVVDSIKAAADRLTHSTNFLNFMAQHALIMQEELPAPVEEHIDEERYHFIIYYFAHSSNYSTGLGAAATICGIVIGAMAVARVFSSVYFSA